MNGTIILSGGGDIDQTFELDERYFNLLKNGSKILYIPVALEMSPIANESYYKWFSALLEKHDSGNKDIDFRMITDEDVITDLSSYDSIYIGGGNTYKLLNFIIESGLHKQISLYLDNGGVIYGGSAGAIILGQDIRTAASENTKNAPTHNGLNLLNNKTVSCHYTDTIQENESLHQLAKSINSEIIAIAENAGLILDSEGVFIQQVGKVVNFFPEKTSP